MNYEESSGETVRVTVSVRAGDLERAATALGTVRARVFSDAALVRWLVQVGLRAIEGKDGIEGEVSV